MPDFAQSHRQAQTCRVLWSGSLDLEKPLRKNRAPVISTLFSMNVIASCGKAVRLL